MKTMFNIFILNFLVTACSSSYVVSTSSEDTSVYEFNKFAAGKEVEIILIDNTVITATEVYLSADSLYRFNTETTLKTDVVKSDVRDAFPSTNVYSSSDSLYRIDPETELSLYWIDPETKLKNSAVKSEIEKVIYTDKDMWRGGLYGAGVGCAAGMLFWVAVNDSLENSQFVNYMEGLASFGVVGALIGFPVGLINGLIFGYTHEYEFQNAEQQENGDK